MVSSSTRDSDRTRTDFGRDGFAIVRGLCPAETVASMRAAVERDLVGPVGPVEFEADVAYPGAPARRDQPGGDTVRRLLDALGRSAVFARWACSAAVTAFVRDALAAVDIRVVRAHHNCIMTKAPEFSSATGWHQDLRYWSYQRPELVNAWTALDAEAPDNGGMRLIPGSHRALFPDESFDDDRFFREDVPANRHWIDRAVQADLAPGDVLFFHAGVLHAAGANRTEARKRAVVFSYRDAANQPLPGTRSAAKADLDPESIRCR